VGLLAVGLLLGAAPAARAQNWLVSSDLIGTNTIAFDKDVAQSFRTGGNTTGYKLTEVQIRMRTSASDAPAYTVKINEDSNGVPGTVLGTLTKPAVLGAVYRLQGFTVAGAGIDLAATMDDTSDPAALIVADDGSYFIADRLSNSVLRFGRDGGFRRAFGRGGQEPGEFTVVGVQGFVAGDLLGFVDLRPMSLEIFEEFAAELSAASAVPSWMASTRT